MHFFGFKKTMVISYPSYPTVRVCIDNFDSKDANAKILRLVFNAESKRKFIIPRYLAYICYRNAVARDTRIRTI